MRRHAFTLIELMVVVSIILILVSIMLPSMRNAVAAADEAVCSSNLHQQGLAMTNYVASSRYYPGCHCGVSYAGACECWPTRLRQFGASRASFYCPAEPLGWQWQTVYGTPGTQDANGASYASVNEVNNFSYELGEILLSVHTTAFSYGYNDWGAMAASTDDRNQRGLGGDMRFNCNVNEIPYSRVRQPAQMIAIADVTNTGSWRLNLDPTGTAGDQWPSDIHRGGARFLFADGHVEWRLQGDMVFGTTNPDAWSLAQRDIAKLWNNTNYWDPRVTP